MTQPLSLSDKQMNLVQQTLRGLPVEKRDDAMRRLAARLAPSPSDAAVAAALNLVLDNSLVFWTE